MAVRIQKTARKAYIEGVKRKIEETRTNLAAHTAHLRTLHTNHLLTTLHTLLDNLASSRHHLLGTSHIPGTNPSTIHVPTELLKLDLAESFNLRRKDLAPLVKVPENLLRESSGVKEWVRKTVGKNPRGIRVKPPREEAVGDEEREKVVQGPFLPKHDLDKKKRKPLRPSLRVQTDYWDPVNANRQEKAREVAMRVTSQPFETDRHVTHPPPDYFLKGDPYRIVAYGRKTFREEDPTHRIAPKDFQNVLAPVPLFDDLADRYY
ncbi:spermatogenesis-associated protein 17 [Borealophlyctis nickersoniae]|nr:spermatogenesis-associated protein 17 [Borealophlyctis nickersoniae]